jgi:hypothetical protein
MKINLNKSPHENCQSFDKCQFNKCPLHPDFKKLEVYPEDRVMFNFHKCRCSKKKRMEIAAAFKLKNKGLFQREVNALKMKEEHRVNSNLPKNKDTLISKGNFIPEISKTSEKVEDSIQD